jgi:ABC-2 type transport system permease protein
MKNSLNRSRRIAGALLSTYYAYMLEYRAELFLWALAGSLPIIMMGVWMQASSQASFQLTPVEFARYFITVFFVRQLTVVWVIWDFEKEVVEGKLSPRLLQPLDPFWLHFFGHIAERFARLPLVFILLAVAFSLYPSAFWIPSSTGFFLFLAAIVLAFSLRFLWQYTFALFAFWTEKASSIENAWFILYLFFSGLIAPLDLYPDIVRQIVIWTPFPYFVYFPTAILTGVPTDIRFGFSISLAWLILGTIVNRFLWRKGLKHYSGMGA